MKIRQIAQYSSDLDRSAAFYTALFGVDPAAKFDPPGLLFFHVAGLRLLLDSKAPSALLYVEVDSLDATLTRMADLTTVVTRPHLIFQHENDRLAPSGANEWQAFIRDPDDNLIGLIELR